MPLLAAGGLGDLGDVAIGFRLVLRHPERLTALVAPERAALPPRSRVAGGATLGRYWPDGSASEHRAGVHAAYLEPGASGRCTVLV